jgi:hypothetical protein
MRRGRDLEEDQLRIKLSRPTQPWFRRPCKFSASSSHRAGQGEAPVRGLMPALQRRGPTAAFGGYKVKTAAAIKTRIKCFRSCDRNLTDFGLL